MVSARLPPRTAGARTRTGNIAAILTYVRAGGNLYAQDKQGNPPLHVVRMYCEAVGRVVRDIFNVRHFAIGLKLTLCEGSASGTLRGESPPLIVPCFTWRPS